MGLLWSEGVEFARGIMSPPLLRTVLGQPSWSFESSHVSANLTQVGGHLAPVVFRLGEKTVSPYSVAPWAEETLGPGLPPLLHALRGDFFCAPFGGNGTPWRGERHPPHGEPAGANWRLAGIEHADARLYQDRRTILTPLSSNSMRHTKLAHDIWSAMGSHVSTMTPEAHDSTFAAVSHLPHLLAFAAVNALSAQPQGAGFLAMAGPGFRDFSRIAASDPTMWRDVFLSNKDAVLDMLQRFTEDLTGLQKAIRLGDGEAEVEVGGQRLLLRLGAAPARFGSGTR